MKIKYLLASASVALMAAPALAADVVQDHAIDREGRPVWDARGNCVLTKWENAAGGCNAAAKKDPLKLSKEARTVYFDFNKSTIKASEKAKLDSLSRAVKGSKEVLSVDIFGHADMIGNNGYNQSLSRKRAEAVRSYLTQQGVKTRKVDLKALGESQSVTHCDAKMPRAELISCLAADRRVEIELNYAK